MPRSARQGRLAECQAMINPLSTPCRSRKPGTGFAQLSRAACLLPKRRPVSLRSRPLAIMRRSRLAASGVSFRRAAECPQGLLVDEGIRSGVSVSSNDDAADGGSRRLRRPRTSSAQRRATRSTHIYCAVISDPDRTRLGRWTSLHPDGAWLRLSGGGDRRRQAQGEVVPAPRPGVAGVDRHGRRLPVSKSSSKYSPRTARRTSSTPT